MTLKAKEQAKGKVLQAEKKANRTCVWWVQGKARRPVWLEWNECEGKEIVRSQEGWG